MTSETNTPVPDPEPDHSAGGPEETISAAEREKGRDYVEKSVS